MFTVGDESDSDLSRDRSGGASLGLLLGLGVSIAAHVSFLGFILFLPSHLPLSSAPRAYTVDLVSPDAIGGQLLAGAPGKKRARTEIKAKPGKEAGRRKPVPKPKATASRARVKKAKQKGKKQEPEKVAVHKVVKKAAKKKPKAKAKQKPSKVAKARSHPKAKGKAASKPKVSRKEAGRKQAQAEKSSRVTKPEKREASKPGSSLDTRIAAAINRVGKDKKGQGGRKEQLTGPSSIGPGEGPGGGGTVRGAEFLIYYNAMRSRIKDSWAWVGTARNLKVKVHFSIREDGTIGNVKLVSSSGDRSYDESVLRALRRVGRLDPPPVRYRRDFSDVELEFMPGDLEKRR